MNDNEEEKSEKNQQKLLFGNPINHFPIRNKRVKQLFLGGLGALFVLASILILLINLVITWSAVIAHGRAIILSTLPMPLMMSMIIFLVGAMLIIFIPIHWSDGVTLYEQALNLKKGMQKRHWVWQETIRMDTRLMHIKFGSATIAENFKILLENERNQRLVIRERYHDMETLNNHIRSIILPILNQKAKQRWSQGGMIIFHKDLAAYQNGLKIKNNNTPWSQIERVVIEKRKLIVFSKENPNKPTFKSNIRKIVNLDLFLYFANNQTIFYS